jgi:hypothetical protein
MSFCSYSPHLQRKTIMKPLLPIALFSKHDKTRKNHKTQSSPPKYLNQYFNCMAGPFPTCTTRRRTRQPSDLRRLDPRVGGQSCAPICRPLASGESGFEPGQGRVAGAEVVRSPLPVTAFAPKVVRGTRLPPSALPLSLPRHSNAILTSPYFVRPRAPWPSTQPCHHISPPPCPATLALTSAPRHHRTMGPP